MRKAFCTIAVALVLSFGFMANHAHAQNIVSSSRTTVTTTRSGSSYSWTSGPQGYVEQRSGYNDFSRQVTTRDRVSSPYGTTIVRQTRGINIQNDYNQTRGYGPNGAFGSGSNNRQVQRINDLRIRQFP